MPHTARARALSALEGARQARSSQETAEQAVRQAVALAPDDPDVRIGAYKFYFYNTRLREAVDEAEHVVRLAALALGLTPDWRQVQPGDAAFATLEKAPRHLVQSLIALSYCRARLGHNALALEGLEKAVALDPADPFGARRLIAVIQRGGLEIIEE